jgi:hypothetical protein
MGFLSKLLRKDSPSPETIEARERLKRVHKDDHKINAMMQKQRDVIRKNHLGIMIAEALRSNKT